MNNIFNNSGLGRIRVSPFYQEEEPLSTTQGSIFSESGLGSNPASPFYTEPIMQEDTSSWLDESMLGRLKASPFYQEPIQEPINALQNPSLSQTIASIGRQPTASTSRISPLYTSSTDITPQGYWQDLNNNYLLDYNEWLNSYG